MFIDRFYAHSFCWVFHTNIYRQLHTHTHTLTHQKRCCLCYLEAGFALYSWEPHASQTERKSRWSSTAQNCVREVFLNTPLGWSLDIFHCCNCFCCCCYRCITYIFLLFILYVWRQYWQFKSLFFLWMYTFPEHLKCKHLTLKRLFCCSVQPISMLCRGISNALTNVCPAFNCIVVLCWCCASA